MVSFVIDFWNRLVFLLHFQGILFRLALYKKHIEFRNSEGLPAGEHLARHGVELGMSARLSAIPLSDHAN